MAFLNSAFAFLGAAPAAITPSVTAPGSMWHLLILNVFSFVSDYGWRIVVFTVLLKVVLSPLDFYQRYKMHKNQKITERLKPTMEKIQKQYGNDKQAFSQKQMELNRKEGYSYFSSCLPMILTLVIFITLWTSMQTVAEYMTFKEYTAMYDEYRYVESVVEDGAPYQTLVAPYTVKIEEYNVQIEPYSAQIEEYDAQLNRTDLSEEDRERISSARAAAAAERDALIEARRPYMEGKAAVDARVSELSQEVVFRMYYHGLDRAYENSLKADPDYADLIPSDFSVLPGGKSVKKVQASFLWIKNIWAPDVPWGDQAVLDWSKFTNGIDDYKYASTNGLKPEQHSDAYNKEMYNTVTGKILADKTQSRTNGYLILPILVVLLSLASQLVSSHQQKKAGQVNAKGGMATSMKVMMVVMPIMMAVFAIQYASIFALYMTVNSATTLIFNFIFTNVIKLMDSAKQKRKYGIVTTSRASSSDSPIIHYVKGANPNAGVKGAPFYGEQAPAEDAKGSKKSKKAAQQSAHPSARGGRPDPRDLMNMDMSSKSDKKK